VKQEWKAGERSRTAGVAEAVGQKQAAVGAGAVVGIRQVGQQRPGAEEIRELVVAVVA
jgi:hypothetical protein